MPRVGGSLILESSSSPTTIKKTVSKDTVFFRLQKSIADFRVEMPRVGGSLILEPSSSPTTIKKPESKDSGFFSSVEK